MYVIVLQVVRIGNVGAPLRVNPEAFDDFTAAIYRAKTRILQLVEYEMVLFFDADVVFHMNCDDLFEMDYNFIGKAGSNSPLNAGMFLIRPSWQALVDINDVALSVSFDQTNGWLEYGPIPDWRTKEPGATTDWSFYGGSVEQGLFYYYYFCRPEGGASLLLSVDDWEDRHTHFTGFSKPFLLGKRPVSTLPERFRAPAQYWFQLFETLAARHNGADEVAGNGGEAHRVHGELPQGYPLTDAYPPGALAPAFFGPFTHMCYT